MKRVFALLAGFLFCLIAAAQQRDSVYLFSYFKNNGKDGLHLAWS